MIVTFLGTRGEIEEFSLKHRNSSALLIHHKPHLILVDFGKNYKELPEGITEVIVSHAHPDHAFGLRGKQLSIPVYMNKFSNHLLSKEHYPFRRKIFWRKPFNIGDVKITPIPVLHSIRAPASGLIFEVAGRKIAYFPDVLSLRDPMEALHNVDVYIGDGASLDRDLIRRREGKVVGHASIRTQLVWLEKVGVKRAVFTHFGKWAMSGKLQPLFAQLSEEFNVRAREAFDGYRIHVGRTISLQRKLPGIYLTPPHAANIIEGYKTVIISGRPAPERYMHKPIFLLQDDKLYGILILTKEEQRDAEEARTQLRDEHQISDREWKDWWPNLNKVWVYRFKIQKAFIPPKTVEVPQGVQKWVTSVKLESIEQVQQAAENTSPYAPVRHYGDKLGRNIKLAEILEAWSKPIVLKKGFITLMGGLTNWGSTRGDIDILQADAKEVVARDQPIIFRLGRALAPELAERLRRRFVGEYGGVFTSHVPVYDLVLVPAERKLVRMQRVEALRDPEGRSQASISLKEDKVIAGRYVAPLKGYRAYYKFPEEAAMDIEHEFSTEDFPLFAQKKYDGAITEWLRDGDKIIVRTDSGFDVTHRLPKLVERAKSILPRQSTVLCETEMWIEGQHQPREVVSGYLNPKARQEADDSNIVANAFDIMFDGEDLHKLGYVERYKHLRAIHWGQSTDEVPKPGFNLTPSILVHSPTEILAALKKTAGFIASEGTVLKTSTMTYELDGLTKKMLKWKKLAEIHAIVTMKHETKTAGVFTLFVSLAIPSNWKIPNGVTQRLDNKSYMFIGKTFNVSQDVKIGDVVSVSFHTMNWYKKSDGTQYITIYEPKFIDKSTHEKPDDAAEAVEVARQKELLTTKHLQNFLMDDKAHESVMQVHYRGRSAHMDFRIKTDNQLLGPTMLIEKPNAILDEVNTVSEAKAIERRWDHYFKLKNLPQTEITDPRRKIQVTWKAIEPVEWMKVEKVVEPGEVGATKTEYGVFSIVDRPIVYFGAQKTYFKEYFISGKLIDGRWVVRLLKNPWGEKPAFVFMMWKPEDQTPYVLTKRAVQRRWIPPVGISALPPSVRSIVPAKFKYWNKNNITERLAMREALVDAIEKGEVRIHLQHLPEVRQPATVPAVLQHRWWRGQYVVRGGPTDELWDLILKTDPLVHFVLRDNLQTVSETNGTLEKGSWREIKGIEEIKPGQEGNPTPNTPAFRETLDSGDVKIWESKAGFLKITFNMKKLKGMFTFTQLDPHQNLWKATREKEAP